MDSVEEGRRRRSGGGWTVWRRGDAEGAAEDAGGADEGKGRRNHARRRGDEWMREPASERGGVVRPARSMVCDCTRTITVTTSACTHTLPTPSFRVERT